MRYIIVVVCCLLFLVAGIALFSYREASIPSDIVNDAGDIATNAQIPAPNSREAPHGWREYHSEQYRFSLFYPEAMSVDEFDEGDGVATITFENTSGAVGFQIFIVPYSKSLISEERFRQDVPSGVRRNAKSAIIDGVEAVTFTSVDLFLGETREVWFIYRGHLYEITTLAGVGNWFTTVIQSWRFI